MKSLSVLFVLIVMGVLVTSCLKNELGTTNATAAEISRFQLYYKWQDTTIDQQGTANENTRITIRSIELTTTNVIDKKAGTIKVTPKFPANGFPAKYRNTTTTARLWGVASVSYASTIGPINGSPQLGTPGDYSKSVTYEVTAANGSRKIWTITVEPLM